MPTTALTADRPSARKRAATLFSFPDPVNEIAARTVAAGVVLMSALTIALQEPRLSLLIAYGFLARVATGPKLSPLGLLATRVVVPRLPFAPRPVPGPPKRFAQAIGAALSLAAVLAFAAGGATVGYALLGALIVAAGLESALGVCLGCKAFALLMRAGIVPERVCERCNAVGAQPPALG